MNSFLIRELLEISVVLACAIFGSCLSCFLDSLVAFDFSCSKFKQVPSSVYP